MLVKSGSKKENFGGEIEFFVGARSRGRCDPADGQELFEQAGEDGGIRLGRRGELGTLVKETVLPQLELNLPTWRNEDELHKILDRVQVELERIMKPRGLVAIFDDPYPWSGLPARHEDNERYNAADVAARLLIEKEGGGGEYLHGIPLEQFSVTQLSGTGSGDQYHWGWEGYKTFFCPEMLHLSNLLLESVTATEHVRWWALWWWMRHNEPTLHNGRVFLPYTDLDDMERRWKEPVYLIKEDDDGLVPDLERHPTLQEAESDPLFTTLVRSFLRPSPANGNKPPTGEIRKHRSHGLDSYWRTFRDVIQPAVQQATRLS